MQVFQVLRIKFTSDFELIHHRHQRRARAGVQRATSVYLTRKSRNLRLGLRALTAGDWPDLAQVPLPEIICETSNHRASDKRD